MSIVYLNSQAQLYHRALEATEKDIVQVFCRGFDGVFMTQEAYEVLKGALDHFELQTHQSLLWDASVVAVEFPDADIYGTLDIVQELWRRLGKGRA